MMIKVPKGLAGGQWPRDAKTINKYLLASHHTSARLDIIIINSHITSRSEVASHGMFAAPAELHTSRSRAESSEYKEAGERPSDCSINSQSYNRYKQFN